MPAETLFDELKRYVGFQAQDEQVLKTLHPLMAPHFESIAQMFYERILEHEGARKALMGGESQVGRLKVTLVQWLEKLFTGPYDDAYFEMRLRIGRVHVRIALPQHYMFGAMSLVREQLHRRVDELWHEQPKQHQAATSALAKILDLELAIMLHSYREDLLAQQARTERLATFGQLVGSIGHELRNPLGVIETSLFILKSKFGADERGAKHFDRIGEQLQIANDIISQLLEMIREKPLVSRPVSLADVLKSVIESVSKPEEIQWVTGGFEALPQVQGDATQLRQVFFNLIDNALSAVAGQGSIAVRGEQRGNAIVVTFEDSGPGVSPQVLSRLFEPLVSTKEKGIGLGLALVRRLLERHGGSVSYSKATLGGARFTVTLPLQE